MIASSAIRLAQGGRASLSRALLSQARHWRNRSFAGFPGRLAAARPQARLAPQLLFFLWRRSVKLI
jgi:hypothetical protein